jgi:hypothetical protein
MRLIYKFLFVSVVLFESCKSNYNLVNNLWVGTSRSIDMTIAYPYFIQIDGEEIDLLNFRGQVIDSANMNDFMKTGDTINFASHPTIILWKDHDVLNTFHLQDSIRFPIINGFPDWKYRSRFRNAVIGQSKLSHKVNTHILNKTFRCPDVNNNPNMDLDIHKYWIFENDQMYTLYEYYYEGKIVHKEYQKNPITFTEINGQLFISENVDDENNPMTLFQILNIQKSGMVLRYFEGPDEIITEVKKVENRNITADVSAYTLCFDGFQGEYYFSSNNEVTFQNGNEYLVNKISENQPISKGDGYINIHFSVNCEGKVGHIGLEQMDVKYQKTNFSFDLVNHVIGHVLQLKNWPTIKSDFLEYKDVHAFLMFKIQNGKIIDLCP